MHVNASSSAIVRIDRETGAALETNALDLPGTADQYHRWSADGRLIAYEAISDGSWDLWVTTADGSAAHRITDMPGSERGAAWHPRQPIIYFISNDAIWRIPVDSAGRASGPPQIWLKLPGRMSAAHDALDFTRDGNRVLVSLHENASDLWLVER